MRGVLLALSLFVPAAAFGQSITPTGGGTGSTSFANPTATAGPTVVNGSASTALRSDSATPVQKATNAQFGLAEGDGQSITCVAGVCSGTAPNRPISISPIVIGVGDMGGQINWTGSSAGTVSNVTITSTLLAAGQSVALCNQSTAALTLPTAPVINGYTALTLPAVANGVASCINLLSNGTTLDAIVSTNAALPTPTMTGGNVTLIGPRAYYACTGTCTVTLPVPVAGYEFCIRNDDNISTVITLAALGSSARYEQTARTSYGTAGTGTAVSSGAVTDQICLLGKDSTHYYVMSSTNAWTMN